MTDNEHESADQAARCSCAATSTSTGCWPTRSSPPTSPQPTPTAEEMDRVYAMNLAMIRKAAQMTQVEVARKLGVGQGVVSRLEHRGDMLLSTLYDYLTATGADSAEHRRHRPRAQDRTGSGATQ